jgi:hypothetical protein
VGIIYLIHFDRPLAHARHYIGFSTKQSPLARLKVHRANQGAHILRVLNTLGIGYHVARVWRKKKRSDERDMKNAKCAPHHCPFCNPHKKRFKYRLHKK